VNGNYKSLVRSRADVCLAFQDFAFCCKSAFIASHFEYSLRMEFSFVSSPFSSLSELLRASFKELSDCIILKEENLVLVLVLV